MELLWDHNVVDVLADGYDVHYGARSIKYEVFLQYFSHKPNVYLCMVEVSMVYWKIIDIKFAYDEIHGFAPYI